MLQEKHIYTFMSLALLAILLSACSTFSQRYALSPGQRNQACEDLRYDINQNSTTTNIDNNQGSPTKQAYLYQQYNKYGCEQREIQEAH